MGLAIYQIIGSLVTIFLIVTIVKNINAGVVLALIPIVAWSLVSLCAGIVYFIKGNELRFYTLSKLNFCFQLIRLSVPGFAFTFFYGPYLAAGFDFNDHTFVVKFETLTANFDFRIGQTEEYHVLCNLVALFLLLSLRWIERNPVVDKENENAFGDDWQPLEEASGQQGIAEGK